jgi:hypothetical protein
MAATTRRRPAPGTALGVDGDRRDFLAVEQVRYGSDLLAVLLIEAATRVRQQSTARASGTLTQPYRW